MTFPAFVLSLRGPGLSLCPDKLRQALGMTRSAFARLIGVHRNSLARTPGYKAGEGMARVVRALSAGYQRTGSVDAALLWFARQPIIGHRTPAELVAAGEVDAVVALAQQSALHNAR